MREIKANDGESLDSVYARLKDASRSQQVYTIYNGKMINPDLSLDDAYKTVYECTKKEYELKQKIDALIPDSEEEEFRSLFDDKPDAVIRDISIAIFMGTEDPVFQSTVALNYIKKMSEYAKYCKEEKRDEWKRKIVSSICTVEKNNPKGEVSFNDKALEDKLTLYEILGKILKAINKGMPWQNVKTLVDSFSLTEEQKKELVDEMSKYSDSVNDFVNNVINKNPMTYKLD